jgi:hypothetical protein
MLYAIGIYIYFDTIGYNRKIYEFSEKPCGVVKNYMKQELIVNEDEFVYGEDLDLIEKKSSLQRLF